MNTQSGTRQHQNSESAQHAPTSGHEARPQRPGVIMPLRPAPPPEPQRRVPLLQRCRDHARSVAAEVFDDAGLDAMFQHARNILTGTVLIAAGLDASRHTAASPLTMLWNVHHAGYLVAGVGVLLLLLNLWDGLRRLSNRRHALVLRVLAIAAYVVLSLRLTQVILHFRAVM